MVVDDRRYRSLDATYPSAPPPLRSVRLFIIISTLEEEHRREGGGEGPTNVGATIATITRRFSRASAA